MGQKYQQNTAQKTTDLATRNPLNPGVTHLIPIGKTPVNPLLSVYGGMKS